MFWREHSFVEYSTTYVGYLTLRRKSVFLHRKKISCCIHGSPQKWDDTMADSCHSGMHVADLLHRLRTVGRSIDLAQTQNGYTQAVSKCPLSQKDRVGTPAVHQSENPYASYCIHGWMRDVNQLAMLLSSFFI